MGITCLELDDKHYCMTRYQRYYEMLVFFIIIHAGFIAQMTLKICCVNNDDLYVSVNMIKCYLSNLGHNVALNLEN